MPLGSSIQAFVADNTKSNLRLCLEDFLSEEMFVICARGADGGIAVPMQAEDDGLKSMMVFTDCDAAHRWWSEADVGELSERRASGDEVAQLALQTGADKVIIDPHAVATPFRLTRPVLETLERGELPTWL